MSEKKVELKRIDRNRWMIPQSGAMRVPGIIYSSEKLLNEMGADQSPCQVVNVAHLPGIVNYALAMPDMHWGYGFPIGGVAAFGVTDGIISPGGVGYDINCGCRLVKTRLFRDEMKDQLPTLMTALFQHIPSGVGSRGALKLSEKEEKKVLAGGSRWALANGYANTDDVECTEDGGGMPGADPEKVSARALERGRDQLGTLGSGNHFLEIEVVEEIFDREAARVFGLELDQIAVLIHSGSRGLGYQVCDDYLAGMVKHINDIGVDLPDRQLACAYVNSARGKDYFAAMACAANYAWVNRQVLMHYTREIFEKALNKSPRETGMTLLYDVCHNIAKMESFPINDKFVELCVHRKGATRSFPPGHPSVPQRYRTVGQPVLIPGDMGTGAYVMAGTKKAFEETFGSTCHGAGRLMSRSQAIKASRGRSIAREMADKGVIVMATGKGTMNEEMPDAYKDLDAVVDVVHDAGISRKVAKLKALGCIKG